MLKKLLSYFVPVNIYRQKSAWSRNLEITWNNGQLVLDSANTNYSYGSLQRILRRGLREIGFDPIRSMDHILVLGVAGGSVIRTLVDECGFKGKISGVEIDHEVIAIANRFFNLGSIPNLNIFIEDAFEFVLRSKEQYDLIIIDIFQDTDMPNFLFESYFIERTLQLLHTNGSILFNTMLLNEAAETRNACFKNDARRLNATVSAIPRVEQHNELIILRKNF